MTDADMSCIVISLLLKTWFSSKISNSRCIRSTREMNEVEKKAAADAGRGVVNVVVDGDTAVGDEPRGD